MLWEEIISVEEQLFHFAAMHGHIRCIGFVVTDFVSSAPYKVMWMLTMVVDQMWEAKMNKI